jgi:CBS domain-containing protein
MMKAAFEGVTVADVMTPEDDLHTVSPDISVAGLVGRMVKERHTGYPVVKNGELVGLVTLDDAREVREVERDAYTVEEVMSRDLTTVSPETDAMTAITKLQKEGVGRFPVTDEFGNLVGLISRSDLMTAFDIIKSSQRLKPRETLEGDEIRGRPPGDADPEFGRRGN